MKIYDGFADIADSFDVLLVDAYGVFWDGSAFYEGSREIMEKMVKCGKPVCIVSNTTQLAEAAINSYRKRGLEPQRHFTDMVTSGDAARETFAAGGLDIDGNRIFVFGNPRKQIFEQTPYVTVDEPREADAFYISIPQLTNAQYEKLPALHQHFYLSRMSSDDGPAWWDSMVIDPFLPQLRALQKMGLPAICANPDFRAFEKPKNGDVALPVVRQGLVAEAYRKMGGRVIEFGKPHPGIFKYAFRQLGIEASPKVAMIGDTYRTDIVGALNAGVTPVWCVECGMAKYEIEQGKSLEEISGGRLEGVRMIRAFGGVAKSSDLLNRCRAAKFSDYGKL